uniref:DNA -binding domain-containing protein n=1 Tax=Sphingomonas sp. OTU376 TaxID=3043863 RepID=UPI00313CC646
MILRDVDGLHRLWMRAAEDIGPLAYVLIRDDHVDLRHAAVRRLDRRLAGAPPARLPPGFRPTTFQRQRLSLLLDLLDAVLAPAAAYTSYELARKIVYSGLSVGRGAEWKSSSQRRRTQRLVEEAMTLMNGGYRTLLCG